MTKAQLRALRWLAEHEGRARPDRWCRMVGPDGDICKSKPETWLRLMISGHVCPHMVPDHVGITMDGLEAIR